MIDRGFVVGAHPRTLDSKEFEIYRPFRKAKNSAVIFTYGISHPDYMEPVVNELKRIRDVEFVVGYAKSTHNLTELRKTLLAYDRMGFEMKLIPNCHAKIWILDGKHYVGSANFCRNTCPNIMVRDHKGEAREFAEILRCSAYSFDKETDLLLCPNWVPSWVPGSGTKCKRQLMA